MYDVVLYLIKTTPERKGKKREETRARKSDPWSDRPGPPTAPPHGRARPRHREMGRTAREKTPIKKADMRHAQWVHAHDAQEQAHIHITYMYA